MITPVLFHVQKISFKYIQYTKSKYGDTFNDTYELRLMKNGNNNYDGWYSVWFDYREMYNNKTHVPKLNEMQNKMSNDNFPQIC